MDFSKLQRDVAALIAPVRVAQQKAAETRRMSAVEFAEYADQQIKKAQKEDDAGHRDLSKRRLIALQSEVSRLAKFEFKSNELPSVTVYKDPDQLDTTEREESIQGLGSSQSDGQSNWTAKANSLAKQLSEAIGELSNRPTDGGNPQPEPAPALPPQPGQPAQPQPEPAPAGDPPAGAPEKKEAKDVEWPRDLTKSVRPTARDNDADYDWGRDAR